VRGELVRLGHQIAASTVWQILHDAGIGPASRRTGPTWKQFLAAQARDILAVGFVHVDTVLLRRLYALIVIEHGTRRVRLVGITASPDGAWTTQPARNVLMDLGHRAVSLKFPIRDRASQFTGSFDAVFTAPLPKPIPSGSTRSTSPSTRSAGSRYSGDSPASTTPPPYHPALLRGNAGHRPNRISEPHRSQS
jgi:hypothetical protein